LNYSKPWLVNASKVIIDRTEEELSAEFEKDYLSYLSYFSNVDALVGGKTLNGKARELFQMLLGEILNAYKHRNEAVINSDFLRDLVVFQSKLDLQVTFHFECQNCGGGLGRCPDCLLPYSLKIEDNTHNVACPRCKHQVVLDQTLICECGTEVKIADFDNHVQVYPGAFLLKSIEDFVSQNLDERKFVYQESLAYLLKEALMVFTMAMRLQM
jgi:hypothetical protein